MSTISLEQLLAGVEDHRGTSSVEAVASIGCHPSQVKDGGVFFKCHYKEQPVTIEEAIAAGAAHIVIQHDDPDVPRLPRHVGHTLVANVNQAYARAAANFFGNVHRHLTLIGVTGTKGKTTTCHLIEAGLRKRGFRTGLISSLVLRQPERTYRAINTTPEPLALHAFLRDVHQQGGTHVVIEVSSIGIANERVHGLRFSAVAFTNIGRDHFEYHGSREAYVAAKRRLFEDPSFVASASRLCVINADDPVGAELATSAAGRIVTYGLSRGDTVPDSYDFSESGLTLRLQGEELRLPLVGEYNVANALAATVTLRELFGSTSEAVDALRDAPPLAGRFERVPTTLGVSVYVDFAHTPESVAAVLQAARSIGRGRKCVAVVGCSGKSDRQKRPLIARAAANGSDVCILTSDNPNHEHPASILREMVSGMGAIAEPNRVRTIVDRSHAIAEAIRVAMPDGIVVLMGKGTENYQLINGRAMPHSDRQVAANVLRELETSRHGVLS